MPWIIPLVAEGVKYYGQKQAGDAAGRATAAGIAAQAADRSKAMGTVGDTLKYAMQSPDGRIAQAKDDYLGALRDNSALTSRSYTDVPGANSRYADAVAGANSNATALATKRAQFMSVLRGMQRNRGDVGQHLSDAALTIGGIGQDTADDMRASGLAVEKAGQVNPAYGAVADLLSNYGKSLGSQYTTQPLQRPGASATGDAGSSVLDSLGDFRTAGLTNSPRFGSVFGNANF